MHLFTEGPTRHETSATTGLERSGILIDFQAQRRFRIEQLRELVASTADALANADVARLQVTQLLTIAAEAALADIEGALGRLEAGGFGTCAGCHQAMSRRRLQMMPTARLCTLCHWLSDHGGAASRPTTIATGSTSELKSGLAADSSAAIS